MELHATTALISQACQHVNPLWLPAYAERARSIQPHLAAGKLQSLLLEDVGRQAASYSLLLECEPPASCHTTCRCSSRCWDNWRSGGAPLGCQASSEQRVQSWAHSPTAPNMPCCFSIWAVGRGASQPQHTKDLAAGCIAANALHRSRAAGHAWKLRARGKHDSGVLRVAPFAHVNLSSSWRSGCSSTGRHSLQRLYLHCHQVVQLSLTEQPLASLAGRLRAAQRARRALHGGAGAAAAQGRPGPAQQRLETQEGAAGGQQGRGNMRASVQAIRVARDRVRLKSWPT